MGDNLFEDLTELERKFCEEYVIDCHVGKAAWRAGITGYEKQGYYYFGKPRVKAFIKYLQDNSAKTAGITIIRNMKELAKIAYGSAANLRKDWSELRDWKDLTDDEKSILSEIKVTTKSYDINKETVFEETIFYKTHDKLRAIEQLNKLCGFNAAEKVEHTGKDGAPIQITGMIIKKE